MKITMTTTAIGPETRLFKDKSYDLPKEEAEELIKANSAVPAKPGARIENLVEDEVEEVKTGPGQKKGK